MVWTCVARLADHERAYVMYASVVWLASISPTGRGVAIFNLLTIFNPGLNIIYNSHNCDFVGT